MTVELNLDYIKLLMKDIGSCSRLINAPSIKRKADMILDHISQAEKDHNEALTQLEEDLKDDTRFDMFREGADIKDTMVGEWKHV